MSLSSHQSLVKNKRQSFIRRLVLVVAIVEPLTTIPQVFEVWINQKTEGISLITWSLYVVAALIWLAYGIQIKDKPLIISSSLWVLTELSIVIGILIV